MCQLVLPISTSPTGTSVSSGPLRAERPSDEPCKLMPHLRGLFALLRLSRWIFARATDLGNTGSMCDQSCSVHLFCVYVCASSQLPCLDKSVLVSHSGKLEGTQKRWHVCT